MSPVQRPISGPELTFTLADEIRIVREQLGGATRIARTLVKNDSLRATLIGLAPGGALAPHTTDGPITVQVLEGEIEFDVEGQARTLATGSLVALGANVRHGARSSGGAMLLLTIAASSGGEGTTHSHAHPPSME